MLGNHKQVIKILIDNGANISSGDVGRFACIAAEKNDIKLLKDIIQYGGDVTKSTSNGTTAIHTAVCEGNVEIVKFLMEQGADIDKQDNYGWTPRAYADHQCHEEIINMFQKIEKDDRVPYVIPPMPTKRESFIGRSQSETSMVSARQGISTISLPPNQELTWSDNHQKRRVSPFQNSFFGMPSVASRDKRDFLTSQSSHTTSLSVLPSRVMISCKAKRECPKRLVFLPKSLEELLHVGSEKFNFSPTKVLTEDGAEIKDINLIRDGDHLILA